MVGIGTPALAAPAEPPPVLATMIQACRDADVVLIAARGSGEASGSYQGLGSTMWSAYRSMHDEMQNNGFGGQNLRAVAVVYDAQPVHALAFQLNGQNAFFRSINVGVDYTKTLLNDYRSRPECAGKGLMLAGYSQGAMVMHRVLHDQRAISGVNLWSPLLVADGDRVSGDFTTRFGGAAGTRSGVGQNFTVLGSGSQPQKFAIPDVRDVCVSGDAVCAPTLGKPPTWCMSLCARAWQVGSLLGGVSIHTKYADSPLLDLAARAIPR